MEVTNNTADMLTDDFFEKCGLGRMRSCDIVGEIEAISMLSNYRDVEVNCIDESDPAVRYLQGKSLRTLRKSLKDPTEAPRLSLLLASGSSASTTMRTPPPNTQPHGVSSVTSHESLQSAISNRTDFTPLVFSPQSSLHEFSDTDEDIAADDEIFADNEYETDAGITPGSTFHRSPSQTATQSQLYSFLDEEYDSENDSKLLPYIAFGYYSETVTDDEKTHQQVGPSHRPMLSRTASDGMSSHKSSRQGSAKTSRRNSRLLAQSERSPLNVPSPVLEEKISEIELERQKTPDALSPDRRQCHTRTHQHPPPRKIKPNLFKSRSAHFGAVSDDMLYTKIGLLFNDPIQQNRDRGISESNSMMSSTSYLLYDSEDTPPPPACNIVSELYIHSSNSNRR